MASLLEHGGRTDVARDRYPDAPLPWLDLSTGINPIAWDGSIDPPIDLRSLPSPAALHRLETAAAAFFAASAMRVAALPGSELGLRLLRDIGLPGPYRYVAPSYASHADILRKAEAISIDSIEVAAANGGTILLANPNNPDGRVLDPRRLRDIACRLRAAGGWLVVDEAFADALPDASIVPELKTDDHAIVLRSFGKFFGLAGIRLGFMIAPPVILDAVRSRLGSWPVSSIAIGIGTAAYADADWIADSRRRLPLRSAALDLVLGRHGLAPIGDCPLFRLVGGDAGALFERLARRGILTRPFDYDPKWLRLGVPGNDADLARLDLALVG